MRITWSPPAVADIDDLVRHIAADNLTAALSQDLRIRNAIESLGAFPRKGRSGRWRDTLELVVPRTPYVVV